MPPCPDERVCSDYTLPAAPRRVYQAAVGGFLAFLTFSVLVAHAPIRTGDFLVFYLNPFLWYAVNRLLLMPVVYLHEAFHWIAFRAAGTSPRIEPFFYQGKLRGMSVVAPGKWMTRNQFLLALLAPTVGVNGVGLALLAVPSLPVWLRAVVISVLCLHLTGCFGDWRAIRVVLRLPRTTLIEDRDEGFAYRPGPPC